jgi:hypothetical protein
MPNDYALARNARKVAPHGLPESDRNTLTPNYLLGHENHFDPNVHTPEDMIQKGVLRGMDPIKKA